jgi:hypothetical protein
MQLSVEDQRDAPLVLVRRELSGATGRLRKALTVAEEVDWRRDPEAVVLLRDTVRQVENVANQLTHQLQEEAGSWPCSCTRFISGVWSGSSRGPALLAGVGRAGRCQLDRHDGRVDHREAADQLTLGRSEALRRPPRRPRSANRRR